MRADLMRFGAMGLLALASAARAQTAGEGPVLCALRVDPTVGIKVWNVTGRVRFVGWDKDSVVVRGNLSRRKEFGCGGAGSSVKFGIDGNWSHGTAERSDFTAYVPKRGMVSVKTIDADIVGENIGGWFFSVSGSIRLSGEARSVEAESMNGNLDINVSAPWIKARGGDGHVLIRGAPQDVDASTVGGTLSIATGAVLRGQFSSVSGDIHYAATPAPTAIFEFSNHSGAVDLLMPANTSAALALSSIAGPIENGFTRVRPTSSTPRSMKINLGHGDAQLTVRTFKGPIRLRQQ